MPPVENGCNSVFKSAAASCTTVQVGCEQIVAFYGIFSLTSNRRQVLGFQTF